MTNDAMIAIRNLQDSGLLQEIANALRIIQSDIRFRIIIETSREECTVGYLSLVSGSTSQNVSGHLKKMKKMKILASRRSGVQMYYRCVDDRAATLVRALAKHPVPADTEPTNA